MIAHCCACVSGTCSHNISWPISIESVHAAGHMQRINFAIGDVHALSYMHTSYEDFNIHFRLEGSEFIPFFFSSSLYVAPKFHHIGQWICDSVNQMCSNA